MEVPWLTTLWEAPEAAAAEGKPIFVWYGSGGSRAPYEARLRGVLNYDPVKKAFTRFDMIALGDMYGATSVDNWLYRPGRNPVGFAFELVSGAAPATVCPARLSVADRPSRLLGDEQREATVREIIGTGRANPLHLTGAALRFGQASAAAELHRSTANFGVLDGRIGATAFDRTTSSAT